MANNGINAGVVIFDLDTVLNFEDWTAARTLSVAVNGVTIDTGALWAMPGGAAEAIEWLRGDLDRFGVALKPGDIVLAGTPLGLNPVKPGEQVMVLIDDRKYVDADILIPPCGLAQSCRDDATARAINMIPVVFQLSGVMTIR